MDLTTQRRCLTLLAGGLVAGAIATLVWSTSAVAPQPLSQAAPTDGIDGIDANDRDEDEQVAIPQLTLRKPLIDMPPARVPDPPKPASAPPPQQPGLDLTLVGTIIDPRQSFAIVVDKSGTFDVKGVGESLELDPAGVRIQSIESEQVTVEYRGSESTVVLDRSKKAGKRAGGNNRGGETGSPNNRRKRP